MTAERRELVSPRDEFPNTNGLSNWSVMKSLHTNCTKETQHIIFTYKTPIIQKRLTIWQGPWSLVSKNLGIIGGRKVV